jgi:hypothetical protein
MVERLRRNGTNGKALVKEGEINLPRHKHPGGRPSDYDPKFAKAAAVMCKMGARDVELADAFGVCITTIWSWKTRYPEFLSATLVSKSAADEWVERSLYHKATGYTFDSEKIFCNEGEVTRVPTREHVPPSDNAIRLWLMNRRPERWQDKVEHEHKTQIIVQVTKNQFNY